MLLGCSLAPIARSMKQSDKLQHVPQFAASLTPLTKLDGLEEKWRFLERHSNCSFFQSWLWVGTWLANLPPSARCYLLEVTDNNDRLAGLAVIGACTLVRNGFVRARALLLHETGMHAIDRMTIEHNSILAETGLENDVVLAGLRCLEAAKWNWDEFVVSGVSEPSLGAWQAAIPAAKWHMVLRQQSDCPFVDLEVVRAHGGDYLSLLSANARQQVRRSIRAYEGLGCLCLSVASTGEDALDYLHELQLLHNAHWTGLGKEGAFPNDFTRRFHDQLALRGGACGAVQLLRVSAGTEVVGYLYNFVHGGHVYCYQSGLKYLQDAKFRPGLVCHYLAVQHNLQAGNRIYDFLAGPQRYKQSLATAQTRMVWFSLQRNRAIFFVERLFTRAKDVLRRRLRPPSQ